MAEQDLSLLLRYVTEETDGVDPDDWPVKLLNELAFDVLPQGMRVQLLGNRYYEVRGANESDAAMTAHIGQVSLGGYFMGLQRVRYTDYLEADIRYEVNELTVRVNAGDNITALVPVQDLLVFEADTLKAAEVLDGDDELAKEIDLMIVNGTIDLAGLSKLFAGLNPEDMRTQLYLDYLNEALYLPDIISRMVANRLLYLEGEEPVEPGAGSVRIVTPDRGRSFTAVGATYDDGSQQLILCANARTGNDELVKVPVEDISQIIKAV